MGLQMHALSNAHLNLNPEPQAEHKTKRRPQSEDTIKCSLQQCQGQQIHRQRNSKSGHSSAHSGPQEAEAGEAGGWLQPQAWAAQQQTGGQREGPAEVPRAGREENTTEVYSTAFSLGRETNRPGGGGSSDCPSKAHTLKIWSSTWHLGEMMDFKKQDPMSSLLISEGAALHLQGSRAQALRPLFLAPTWAPVTTCCWG